MHYRLGLVFCPWFFLGCGGAIVSPDAAVAPVQDASADLLPESTDVDLEVAAAGDMGVPDDSGVALDLTPAADLTSRADLTLAADLAPRPDAARPDMLTSGDGGTGWNCRLVTSTAPTGYTPIFIDLYRNNSDLNGDGRQDTFFANPSCKLQAGLAQPDGTFSFVDAGVQLSFCTNELQPDLDRATHRAFGILADFDGDGVLDLVYPKNSAEELSFARGQGDGTFATALTQSGFDYQVAQLIAAHLKPPRTGEIIGLPGTDGGGGLAGGGRPRS